MWPSSQLYQFEEKEGKEKETQKRRGILSNNNSIFIKQLIKTIL